VGVVLGVVLKGLWDWRSASRTMKHELKLEREGRWQGRIEETYAELGLYANWAMLYSAEQALSERVGFDPPRELPMAPANMDRAAARVMTFGSPAVIEAARALDRRFRDFADAVLAFRAAKGGEGSVADASGAMHDAAKAVDRQGMAVIDLIRVELGGEPLPPEAGEAPAG
jgi:hypothetical protein